METRCPRCNAPVEYGKQFCGNCGTQIAGSQPVYNNMTQQNNSYQQNAYGQPNPSYQQNVYQQPSPAYQPNAYQQPVNPNPYGMPGPTGAPVSKKEFTKNYANPKNRSGIKTAIVIGYVCAILSFLVNIGVYAIFDEPLTIGGLAYILLYVGVVLGGTIGLQMTYNKGFAIGVLVMAVFDCILTLVLSQRLGGWLVIVGALSAIKALSEIDKEYKQYLDSFNPAYRF